VILRGAAVVTQAELFQPKHCIASLAGQPVDGGASQAAATEDNEIVRAIQEPSFQYSRNF